MKNFTDVIIRTKLAVGFGAMIIFMIAIGSMGYWGITQISGNIRDIFGIRLPSINYLVEANRDMQQLLVAERTLRFTSTKEERFNALLTDYAENLEQPATRFGKFKVLAATPEEQAIIENYETVRPEWSNASAAGELSSQSQQFQEAIAFKIDRAGQHVKVHMGPPPAYPALLRAPAAKTHVQAPKAIGGPEPGRARQSGVLIDLQDDQSSDDENDKDFTRY